jgi:DNA-directed RNA polymerase subunit M/transcription elongation factor TFIIS
MVYFKSCPRCGGDVHADKDWYGAYVNCLQCGWSKDASNTSLSSLAVTAAGRVERREVVKQAS